MFGGPVEEKKEETVPELTPAAIALMERFQLDGVKCMYLIPLIEGLDMSQSSTNHNPNVTSPMKVKEVKVPVQKYPATIFFPKKKPCMEITIESEKLRSKFVFDYAEVRSLEQGYGKKYDGLHRTFINTDELSCITIQTIKAQEVILLMKTKNAVEDIPVILRAMHEFIKKSLPPPEKKAEPAPVVAAAPVSTLGSLFGIASTPTETTPVEEEMKPSDEAKQANRENLMLAIQRTASSENDANVRPSSVNPRPLSTSSGGSAKSNISAALAATQVKNTAVASNIVRIHSFHFCEGKLNKSFFMNNYAKRLIIFKNDRMVEVYSVPKDHDTTSINREAPNGETDYQQALQKRTECNNRLKQFMNTQFQQQFLTSRGFDLQVNKSTLFLICVLTASALI